MLESIKYLLKNDKKVKVTVHDTVGLHQFHQGIAQFDRVRVQSKTIAELWGFLKFIKVIKH